MVHPVPTELVVGHHVLAVVLMVMMTELVVGHLVLIKQGLESVGVHPIPEESVEVNLTITVTAVLYHHWGFTE